MSNPQTPTSAQPNSLQMNEGEPPTKKLRVEPTASQLGAEEAVLMPMTVTLPMATQSAASVVMHATATIATDPTATLAADPAAMSTGRTMATQGAGAVPMPTGATTVTVSMPPPVTAASVVPITATVATVSMATPVVATVAMPTTAVEVTVPMTTPLAGEVAMPTTVTKPTVPMPTTAVTTVALPTQVMSTPVVTNTTGANNPTAPLTNKFPGGINLTITNGAINIKPSTTGVPVITRPEGPNMVIQAPVGQVSGGNVIIRSPLLSPTGGPVVRLPSNPGTLNIQLAGQPGMQGMQGVINSSLINPMLGKTQTVVFQRSPVGVSTVASPAVPLQPSQLTNLRFQRIPTPVQQLSTGQVAVNVGVQGQNVPGTGILGQAVASAGVPTLAVGKSQAGTGLGMAQSKAGTSMGMALGLQVSKTAQIMTDTSVGSSPSQSSIVTAENTVSSGSGEKSTTNGTDSGANMEVQSGNSETNVIEKCETSLGDGKPTTKDEDGKNKGDFDPMEALTWDNGVGTLPGSDLKFRMNEFGMMELIMDDQDTNDSGATTEPRTPDVEADQESSETSISVTVSPETVLPAAEQPKGDEFVRCLQCGTYGMAADFFKAGAVERFCSQACHQTYKAACRAAAALKLGSGRKTVKELAAVKYKKKRLMVDDMNPRPQGTVPARGRPRVRTMEPEDAEDDEVAKTLASAKKTKGFSWNTYLQQERATRPANKLFKSEQGFPSNKNGFKVGMKLEGIDPRHPSLYCVLSVAEVRGYRIRLHFDGYSECHDFWVNASSVDIFPVGWCEKNNKKLQVPKGFTPERFSWQSYLKLSKSQAAPRHLFQSQQAASVTPHGFRVGMKLEAIDKKNTVLICVATVVDIIGDRILIHFDGWEDSYDYWADPTSPYIKPVGYCQETEKALSPPNDCEDIQNFTWESYLKQTKSQPVPARAFKPHAPHQFEIHQKLEVVDKRNPILIRVATIVNVEEYRIKVHFDGWSDVFDDWLDDDCPDFHPPGWCAKTGHPLQPPISPQDLVVSPSQGGCPTPGCKGIGHIKGAKYTGHHSAFGCPYSAVNMNKGNAIQDRLGSSKSDEISPPAKFFSPDAKSNPLAEKRFHSASKYKDMVNGDHRRPGPGRPGRKKHKFMGRVKEEKDEEDDDEDQENFLHNGIHQSVFMSAMVLNPVKDFPLCWEQHSKLLPGVDKIRGTAVAKWSIEEVADFVKTLPGCEEQGKIFQDEQIDGEAFLLLNQTDIVKIMNIKLGPALKIYNSILMFKNTAES